MKNTNRGNISKSFIIFKNNSAVEVNKEFEKLTDYYKNEIIGKTVLEISDILKLSSHVKLEEKKDGINCYIFTKKYEPREVKIKCSNFSTENEQICFIWEKRNSRIENKLPFINSLIKDNKMGIAIFSCKDSIILKLNEIYLNFLNVSYNRLNDFIGTKPQIHDECIFDEIYFKTVNSGEAQHFHEVKMSYPGRHDSYWDITFTPIFIKGKVKYIVQIVTDVTERVTSRNTIEKQKQELEAIIENISDEMLIFNNKGEYLKINKLARENSVFDFNKFKCVDEAYKQVEIFDLAGNKLKLDEIPLKRVLKGEKIANFRLIRKVEDVTQFREVSGTPIYDNEANFILGVLAMRDISDRLKYEHNLYLEAQYKILSNIIENMDLTLSRFTYPDYNLIDLNNKAFKIINKLYPTFKTQESLKGISMSNILHENSNMVELTERLKSGICSELLHLVFDGEDIYYKNIYQPLFDLNNEIIEIIAIGIDVTEEEKAKNLLENNLKIQEEIYSNVVHELKTPLNVIFSANQIMDMYLTHDMFEKDRFISYNNNIKQNCLRLIKLINNIVDLSKCNAGYYKLNILNENIVEIIEGIVNSVTEYVKSKNLNIFFETNVKEKVIACDPNMIDRVMLNLISNAIKFSYAGSNITVSLKDMEQTVEIYVKDEGIGISEENLILLFERFYRVDNTLSRKTEGTGIGLPLIKSIVEQHGGRISVKSKLGQGSVFKIELPAVITHNPVPKEYINYFEDKTDKINIEFSDIYAN